VWSIARRGIEFLEERTPTHPFLKTLAAGGAAPGTLTGINDSGQFDGTSDSEEQSNDLEELVRQIVSEYGYGCTVQEIAQSVSKLLNSQVSEVEVMQYLSAPRVFEVRNSSAVSCVSARTPIRC